MRQAEGQPVKQTEGQPVAIRTGPPGRGLSNKRDWTKGSIVGNLWGLAWPSLVTSSFNAIGPAIDMIWIGRLGASSIAGVGASGIIVTAINSLITGLFTGTAALIARSIGAKDENTALRAAQQAFVIGLAFSILMATIGLLFARNILALLGVDPSVATQGAAYMRIQLVGMVTMCTVTVCQSIMQSSGDTRTPMKMSISYRIFHMGFAPMLIFGLGPFSKMGVSGAALSSVTAQALGGAFGLWFLFSGRSRLQVTLRNFSLDRSLLWRAVKIGIPASLTTMQRSLSELILVWLVTPFGTLAIAAHSLMQRVDMFIQTPSAGLGTAAGVLAAQNLGAGEPRRAMRTGWMAALLATGISAVASIAIWFFAEYMFGIFTNQTSLIDLASSFLRINIVSYMVWGVVVALSMCLNGVGDTSVPMVTNLTTMVGIQITLAYFLSRFTPLGVYGIRWAVVSGIVVRGFIYSLYFMHGRWQRKKV